MTLQVNRISKLNSIRTIEWSMYDVLKTFNQRRFKEQYNNQQIQHTELTITIVSTCNIKTILYAAY